MNVFIAGIVIGSIKDVYINLSHIRCPFETADDIKEKEFVVYSEYDKDRPLAKDDYQNIVINIDGENIETMCESMKEDKEPWKNAWIEWDEEQE